MRKSLILLKCLEEIGSITLLSPDVWFIFPTHLSAEIVLSSRLLVQWAKLENQTLMLRKNRKLSIYMETVVSIVSMNIKHEAVKLSFICIIDLLEGHIQESKNL